MNDKIVTLYKRHFTEKDWLRLSFDFSFNTKDDIVYIHVIDDEN